MPGPLDLKKAIENAPEDFVLDKEKYPDVEVTPYGFIYNVGGRSITDIGGQNKRFGHGKTGNQGFTVEFEGDESYYPTWEDAYKVAKGIR